MQAVHLSLCCAFVVGCGEASPAPRTVAEATAAPTAKSAAEAAPSDLDIRAFALERQKLVEARRLDEADELCARWIARTNALARAEGYKCSANVFIRRAVDLGDSLMISDEVQRLSVGGIAAPPRFSGVASVKAIDQLDQAASLQPSDLSIHQGRMYIALASGDYARAVLSLELSLKQHPDAAANKWLEYADSFPRTEAARAVAYLRLLAAKYPEDAAVLTQLGAWLAVTARPDEAKAALEKALARDERNAMAHWRLGEMLESSGDRRGAGEHYKRSLELPGDWPEERRSAYARFKRARR